MSKKMELINYVLQELSESLAPDDLAEVEKALLICLDKYNIDEKCTSLALSDRVIPKWVGLYIARKKMSGRADGTIQTYMIYITDFFLYRPEDLDDMTTAHALMYLNDIQRRKKICNRTLDQCRVILNTFFRWAAAEGYVRRNFFENVEPIKFVQKVRQPLSSEDCALLRSSCETYREVAMIDVFLSTGVRVSELCGMKWSDIDFDAKTITVFGKGSKYRVVMFDGNTKISLLKYKMTQRDSSGSVFQSEIHPYKGLGKKGVENVIARIKERAGITAEVSPHILRHTFATRALQLGMPIEKLRMLLGHESYDTTLIYAKTETSQIRHEYAKCFGA